VKRYQVLVDVRQTYRYEVDVPDDSTPDDKELLGLTEDLEPSELLHGDVRIVTARCVSQDSK
jgi:hypothetical protein